MVTKNVTPLCSNCMWSFDIPDSVMVRCRWHHIDVYKDSLPCNTWELYEKPF